MIMADATILVVDDEPELLDIFSIWLKRNGATVLKAANGAEALKLLTTVKVNALISDMRMPVMDGVSLVRSIHDLNLAVPTIIFVSGFGDVSPRVLYSLGVEAMLSKPLARNQLLTTLAASLREREELWLQPPPEPAERELAVEFESFDKALENFHFSLGRGGCCLRSTSALPECTVALSLRFREEGLSIHGQGAVRWYDPKTGHAGIEFIYLEPESRAWVMDHLDTTAMQSFIPSCQ